MSIRARLKKIEPTASGAGQHTSGKIIFVDFDEEVPPIPPCAVCNREHRIRFVQFTRVQPETSEQSDT